MASDMPLSWKRPEAWPRAQFQLWIFSYHDERRRSKKCVSRIKFAFGEWMPEFATISVRDGILIAWRLLIRPTRPSPNVFGTGGLILRAEVPPTAFVPAN
jgi:hypothetical protein